MYDHIGLRVENLDASVRFYTAALAPLGYMLCSRDNSGAGFGPKGQPALWLHLHKGKAFTGRPCGVQRGGPRGDQEIPCRRTEGRRYDDNGEAGPWQDNSPTYYAAFLVDPDGNNVEAVCM